MTGDVSKTIQENPALIPGLTEYTQWRQREGERISSSDEQSSAAHPIKAIVKSIESKV